MLLYNKTENKYLGRYINKERIGIGIVFVGANNTPVYFVINPTYPFSIYEINQRKGYKDDMTSRAGNRSVHIKSPNYKILF